MARGDARGQFVEEGGDGAMPGRLAKMPRDAGAHVLVGKLPPLGARQAAQHVEAIAARDRDGAGLAGLEREEMRLELRHRAAARELPQHPVGVARRAVRMAAREGPEALGRRLHLAQQPLRLGERGSACLGIGGIGGDEDVLRLDEVGRAEARAVPVVEGTACRLAGRRHVDLLLEQEVDRVVPAAEATPRRLGKQEPARDEGAPRLRHGLRGRCRWMVLEFREQVGRRDLLAADAQRAHRATCPGRAPRRRTT